jgi:hypothetical protein
VKHACLPISKANRQEKLHSKAQVEDTLKSSTSSKEDMLKSSTSSNEDMLNQHKLKRRYAQKQQKRMEINSLRYPPEDINFTI